MSCSKRKRGESVVSKDRKRVTSPTAVTLEGSTFLSIEGLKMPEIRQLRTTAYSIENRLVWSSSSNSLSTNALH